MLRFLFFISLLILVLIEPFFRFLTYYLNNKINQNMLQAKTTYFLQIRASCQKPAKGLLLFFPLFLVLFVCFHLFLLEFTMVYEGHKVILSGVTFREKYFRLQL